MNTIVKNIVLLLVVVTAVPGIVLADEHDHDHGGTDDWPDCECIVADLDCEDETRVQSAVRYLNEHDCKDYCMDHDHDDDHDHDHDHDHGRLLDSHDHDMKPECARQFMVLDMYHAGCVAGGLPEYIGTAFHEYDGVCYRCFHPSAIIPGEPDCPMEVCDDPGAVTTANEKLNNETVCPDDPINDDCKEDFRRLLTYHDFCPSRDDVRLIGYHTLEQRYEGVHCNYQSNRTKNCEAQVNKDFVELLGVDNSVSRYATSMLWVTVVLLGKYTAFLT